MTEAKRPAPRGAQQPQVQPEQQRREPSHVERAGGEHVNLPVPPTFEAREGDVLIVGYGEVTLPLKLKFSMIRVGGESYTRRLREGDDVNAEHERIYDWLKKRCERDAAEKIRMWHNETSGMRQRGMVQE